MCPEAQEARGSSTCHGARAMWSRTLGGSPGGRNGQPCHQGALSQELLGAGLGVSVDAAQPRGGSGSTRDTAPLLPMGAGAQLPHTPNDPRIGGLSVHGLGRELQIPRGQSPLQQLVPERGPVPTEQIHRRPAESRFPQPCCRPSPPTPAPEKRGTWR